MMVRAPRDEDRVHLEFEIGQCRSALELLKEKEVTKDCKSGRGKLQILTMHIAQSNPYCILHKAQVRRQDKTIAAILAELNYKGTDFNLDYKYISQEFLMKYHRGGKK